MREYRRIRGAKWHYRRDCRMWPTKEFEIVRTSRTLENLCRYCSRLMEQHQEDLKSIPE